MPIPAISSIAPGISASLGKLGSNNGIVRTGSGIVLIDVPHKPTDAVDLAGRIADWGPVSWIIHTDHHIDHTLTNGFFTGTVVAHEGTYAQLMTNRPTPTFVDTLLATLDPNGRELIRQHPERAPEVIFSERLGLRVGEVAIDLLALPGHTPNNIGVHLPEAGVLFSGDVVSGMGLPSSQESSFRASRRSIDVVLALDFEILVPGHGGIGNRATVIRFRQQLDELVGRVDEARRSGMPIDEAEERIRFEDRIHVDTAAYAGYPAEMVETFQRRSIRSIYAELAADQSATAPFVWGDGTGRNISNGNDQRSGMTEPTKSLGRTA